MIDLEPLKSRILQASYTVKANKSLLDKTRTEIKELAEQLKTLETASEVLKRIGEQKKQATILMFERVVTLAIKEVFGFDYQFKIDVQTGARVLTRFKLLQGNQELDIMSSVGGGLIDVVSFVLRALILTSVRPKRTRVLFLDESFRHVSSEYRPRVASLLKSLAKQLDTQFILVTHQAEFEQVADKCYELYKTPEGTKSRQLV